jgi:CRISPR-associated endonuclease Csn1
MTEKVLGIDLGTNSIGWAIVEKEDASCSLLDKGVVIFQKGVAEEKGNEKPMVQTRTLARATRRHYFRRKLRKIELLKVLTAGGFCPTLTAEQLQAWKTQRTYPLDPEFIEWQRTNEDADKNPYHDRYVALTRQLDLSQRSQRYILGRALYHLCQRRGFLSNRKESTKELDGTVKQAIGDLSEKMEQAGCKYLGEYFYMCHKSHEKIRGLYTARNQHIRAEFDAICERQNLPDDLRKQLARAIFYQRPLKSQKGAVGKCTFEPTKSRCPISHPAYEEFRMLSFVNNIKVKTTSIFDGGDYRQLTPEEREQIYPLFLRKSKLSFEFEDIAKKLAGKPIYYGYMEEKPNALYKFNFAMSTSVSNCPVTAYLADIFGEDWRNELRARYKKAGNKTRGEVINDVWHALFSFDDDERLHHWAMANLSLTPEQADAFVKCPIHQGYASLSLNAINKMLPYLRQGFRYDTAVFLANIEAVLPIDVKEDAELLTKIKQQVITLINDYEADQQQKTYTKVELINDFLLSIPGVECTDLRKLYHPSQLQVYPAAQPNSRGEVLLGSPRVSAIRNPMAMRALFQLRHLINTLLLERKIDRTTKINIEFSRELNDANMRKAIQRYQRENEATRKKYRERLIKEYRDKTGREIIPSDTDILKYQLWEEQQHLCLYTNQQIDISEFLGDNPKYDIEHTVPRSRGGDDSMMNKTLCDCRYNRSVKRAKLPSELADHARILAQVEELGWREKIDDLRNQINRTKGRYFATKEQKDQNIQRRHYLELQLKYWCGKYERFVMTEVPQGFSNRQGVDIGIIGRYARMYLASVFHAQDRNLIYTVKGATTSDFRKMWGLQEEYTSKERVNHCHHCIDAIVIACIGKAQYDAWAQYCERRELAAWDCAEKPSFPKPWETFTQDVKGVVDELLVVHHTPDNTLKQSKKALRVRGKIQKTADGRPIYQQGDTARAQLHLQTFYGAIERDGEIRYVIRKQVDSLEQKDVKNIVDDAVRAKVEEQIAAKGFAMAIAEPIWMNEAKRIPIKKVRLYANNITKPIHLKPQRDLSRKEYKRDYHVANDGNYCLAIYEGCNDKGKVKRSYKLINNLTAVRSRTDDRLVPLSDDNEYPLKWILKVGMMVLLYEKSPEEVYNATKEELVKRLYKVTGLALYPTGPGYGGIVMRYHQEARPAGEYKNKNGAWTIGEVIRPSIFVYHTQFKGLVEGQDFEISDSGEIKFFRMNI